MTPFLSKYCLEQSTVMFKSKLQCCEDPSSGIKEQVSKKSGLDPLESLDSFTPEQGSLMIASPKTPANKRHNSRFLLGGNTPKSSTVLQAQVYIQDPRNKKQLKAEKMLERSFKNINFGSWLNYSHENG